MIMNMSGKGGSRPAEPILQDKTVTPSSLPYVVDADSGYDGLNEVVVNPDPQLKAENIRSGKTVFGVTGTFEGVSYAEGEFWKKVVSAKEGTVIEAEPGLVTIDHCNSVIHDVVIGSKGLDLSSIRTTSVSPLLDLVTANGPLAFSCETTVKASTLMDLPLGDWTMGEYMFQNTGFRTDEIRISPNNIPEGVIPWGAFLSVKALSGTLTVHVPSTVTEIQSYNFVFTTPESGTVVMESAVPPTLGDSSMINVRSVVVPKGSLEAYQTATNWSSCADKMTEVMP